MNEFILKILSCIIRFWSRIYTYHCSQWILTKRNKIYTQWIRNFIGEVGMNSVFQYPLRLQGGGARRIRIGSDTRIQANSIICCCECYGSDEYYKPEIVIGNDCNIGEYCHITAIQRITIGNGLLTGRFVYIGDNSHGVLSLKDAETPPAKRHLVSKGEIIIGNNVWIGDKVTILGGVTIGDNVIIGAGSIVTHDVPSNSLAVGIPAKVVKSL